MAEPAAPTQQTAVDKDTGLFYGRNPTTGNIEKVGAEAFAQYGYQPVTKAEALPGKTAEKRSEKVGIGDAIALGTGRGLVNTITGGVGDLDGIATSRGLGGAGTSPEAQADLQQRWSEDVKAVEDEHPMAAAGAELVSNIVGLAITGGGIPGAAAKKLVPNVAGVPRTALRGAAEAAFFGPASAARQAAVENRDLDADLMFAHTAGLAGLGGILAGAGGALTRGRASKALTAGEDVLGANRERTGAEVLAHANARFDGDVSPKLADLIGAAGTGSEPEVVARLKRDPNVRQLARPGAIDEMKDKFATDLADEASKLVDISETARHHAGAVKFESALAHADGSYLPQVQLAATEAIEAARARVAEALEAGGVKPKGAGKLKRYLGALNEAEEAIAAAGGSEANQVARAFSELDLLKRKAGTIAEGGKVLNAWSDASAALRDVHDGIFRDVLQNEDIWGHKLAGMQREMNAPYHDMISSLTSTASGYLRQTGKDSLYSPWVQKLAGDPEKFRTLVSRIEQPTKSPEVAGLRQWAESNLRMGETMRKYYQLAPEELSRLKEADTAAKSFLERLNHASDSMAFANQVERVIGPSVFSPGMARVAGGVAGAALGGPVGSALGIALGQTFAGVLAPGYRIKALSSLEHLRQSHDSWVLKLAHKMFGGKELPTKNIAELAWGRPATKSLPLPGEAIALPARGKPRSSTVEAVLYKWFASEDEPKNKNVALANAVDGFRKVAAQPELVRQGIEQQLGQTGKDYPELTDRLSWKVTRAASILAEKFPAPPETIWPGAEPPELGIGDRIRFEGLVEAAFDPLMALQRAPSGTLTPEQVDMMDEIHAPMMFKVREMFMASKDADNPPKASARRQLAILLHMPADPTLTPEYISAMQEMHAMKAQAAEQMTQESRKTYRPTGVNISDVYSSRTMRLERGEPPK